MRAALRARAGAAFLAALAFPGALSGAEPLPTIAATRVAGPLPGGPRDPGWGKLASVEVTLYPQAAVAPAARARPLALALRAAHDGRTLALQLAWRDATRSRTRGIGAFADALAVQWALGGESELPYVGMGHRGHPVALWFWRADGTVETLAAEGFGTLSAQRADGVQAEGAWHDGHWQVVLRRALDSAASPLHARLAPDAAVPVAVAIWDGGAQERDGTKRLSGWHALALDPAHAARAAASRVAGNAANGKRLMTVKGCVACHAFPGNPARPTLGPDLSFAGGIHAPGYLREALSAPDKIILPGKGYATAEGGTRRSIMPPLEASAAEREDLVAFLLTLK
ncbi:MAG: ethylbenzene dehydrogenase-related protein [Burkholderiales bacterium]|nr:ethylbenzene dehydrogenase-related protein [Burkholderiales bacterium]